VTGDVVAAWMTALRERHVEPLGRPAFLKAVRALSVRYVERRHTLDSRSAIDSAGKRAAFAAFYAPVHFHATQLIVQELRLADGTIDTIVDLGCGTGVAGAAWALSSPERPALTGIDANPWAVDETNWTWRTLGLTGRARRGDIVRLAKGGQCEQKKSDRDSMHQHIVECRRFRRWPTNNAATPSGSRSRSRLSRRSAIWKFASWRSA